MGAYLTKAKDFFTLRLWRIEQDQVGWPLSLLLKQLQTFVLAGKGFQENGCALRASALTFYSMLSIVPVFAMIFGIAKGFGVASIVEEQIRENFATQEQVASLLIQFSDAFLKQTKGGLIAGLGLAFLFWTVVRMLGQAERALNQIWGIERERSLLRKFTDYLSLILVCPVLIILSSSLTVALTGTVRPMLSTVLPTALLESFFGYVLQGFPLVILTFAFGFLFFFLPNTKVSLRAALVGGFVAALGYYLLQTVYVSSQVAVTKSNAVYGSFAALPLFLIWLNLSWFIVLFGAQVAFANENRESFLFEPDARGASEHTRLRFAVSIVKRVIAHFQSGTEPPSLREFTASYKAPTRFIRTLLNDLVDAGVLSPVSPDRDGDEELRFQPARPVEQLKEDQIIELLLSKGNQSLLELNPELSKP